MVFGLRLVVRVVLVMCGRLKVLLVLVMVSRLVKGLWCFSKVVCMLLDNGILLRSMVSGWCSRWFRYEKMLVMKS